MFLKIFTRDINSDFLVYELSLSLSLLKFSPINGINNTLGHLVEIKTQKFNRSLCIPNLR